MLKDPSDIEPTEVDQLVLAKLVPPTHDLRRVKPVMDFESFREHGKDGYSPAMGRPADEPFGDGMIATVPLPAHPTAPARVCPAPWVGLLGIVTPTLRLPAAEHLDMNPQGPGGFCHPVAVGRDQANRRPFVRCGLGRAWRGHAGTPPAAILPSSQGVRFA
jgi:hypothetical protein